MRARPASGPAGGGGHPRRPPRQPRRRRRRRGSLATSELPSAVGRSASSAGWAARRPWPGVLAAGLSVARPRAVREGGRGQARGVSPARLSEEPPWTWRQCFWLGEGHSSGTVRNTVLDPSEEPLVGTCQRWGRLLSRPPHPPREGAQDPLTRGGLSCLSVHQHRKCFTESLNLTSKTV